MKNTQIGKFWVLLEQSDRGLSIVESPDDSALEAHSEVKKSRVHFHFCLEGSAVFDFGFGYSRALARHRNYFLFNPEKDLPYTLTLSPGGRMVFLAISIESLHQLFVQDPIPYLNQVSTEQKFYDEREIPSYLLVELSQLFSMQLSQSTNRLFYQGKVLELLALYFSEKKPDTESCPFLNDKEIVRKIKLAKEHLLHNIASPPSLKELSRTAGLNQYQLKVGFKEIYGNSVYSYLLDHKLDNARMLLDSKQYHVTEVAYHVGYSNPSHFIAAFRKKFGVTPKKYLLAKV